MLQYRNTPDRDTKLSPAMCIFDHPIRDFIPIKPGKYRPHRTWHETLAARELALRNRHMQDWERWSERTKRLPPLKVGDVVRMQNQVGPHPLKWDKTGTVIEVRQFDQYVVKVEGSGRVTLHKRKFFSRFSPAIPSPPTRTIAMHCPKPTEFNLPSSFPAPIKPTQSNPVTVPPSENHETGNTPSPPIPVGLTNPPPKPPRVHHDHPPNHILSPPNPTSQPSPGIEVSHSNHTTPHRPNQNPFGQRSITPNIHLQQGDASATAYTAARPPQQELSQSVRMQNRDAPVALSVRLNG